MTHTKTIFPFAISNESHANLTEFLELKCPFFWKNIKKIQKECFYISKGIHVMFKNIKKIGMFEKIL